MGHVCCGFCLLCLVFKFVLGCLVWFCWLVCCFFWEYFIHLVASFFDIKPFLE